MPASRIIHGSSAWRKEEQPSVVTIGNFDGVHLGHKALLSAACDHAVRLHAIPCAFTFDPAPSEILRPEAAPPRIQPLEDRVQALLAAGIAKVIVEPFDRTYAGQDATWFAEEVLKRRLGAIAVVVGWDFRFGRGRDGSVDTLHQAFPGAVYQIPAMQLDDDTVSSSRVRGALGDGDVALAARLLGRPHRLQGAVQHGSKVGRELGFPTANVAVDGGLAPGNGVYAVDVQLPDGTIHRGVVNLGVRPTFGAGPLTMEVHVLDFTADLYGSRLTLHFLHKLRDETTFGSREALAQQIERDIQAARQVGPPR